LEVSKLFQCHQKIKAKMETLHQSGMRMELEWTPGHAEVQGNEIADRLAKEAAKEAQEQDTTVHNNKAGYQNRIQKFNFRKMAT
jgi:ribonuclease HI